MENRRKFSRIVMQLRGTVSSQFIDGSAGIKVLDVSLNGALIEVVHNADALKIMVGHKYIIDFKLDASNRITMQCVCRHKDGKRYGMQCVDIDVQSITILRRLIELNVGMSTLLNRELTELVPVENIDNSPTAVHHHHKV